MSSMYDSIQTAAELVAEVQNHGLSLTQEDICRAQDIFGHTLIEELARLANDIGRNNAKGEPDPKGTWSSGRRATQSTFYSILTNIWNWEDVTRFWNEHTNPQTEKLKKLQEDYDAVIRDNASLKMETEQLKVIRDDLLEQVSKLTSQRDEARYKAAKTEDEIMRLKARLYDLMVVEKESV